PHPELIGRGSSKLYFKMHMRPGSASGGSNLGYGVAARHPVTHLDKILIIVAVQHFTAVVAFDNNSITETALGPALHHPSVSDRVNRGPGRRCDVGSGMITEFAVDVRNHRISRLVCNAPAVVHNPVV